MSEGFIERRIVTGLIVSTEYIREIREVWSPPFISSPIAAQISSWCLEYFDEYNQAPGRDIEGIFAHKASKGLPEDHAEEIEEILNGLSEEYERSQFNVEYLLDQTRQYFQEQNLKGFANKIRSELSGGSVAEAEKLASSYVPIGVGGGNHSAIDPFSSESKIKQAFTERARPLIEFPKDLGKFWNAQLTRDSFVAFMGPEKRGKTFMLMEVAMKGLTEDCNVVFFQAGDMSEAQQIRRLCIYLAKRSDQKRYCEGMFVPVLDCFYNQMDICDRQERECRVGLFEKEEEEMQRKPTHKRLIEAFNNNPDYAACRNCESIVGAVWLKWEGEVEPLKWEEAFKKADAFRKRHRKRFKLCTYPNETLSVHEVKTLLDVWERQEGFVPDVIVIDYADIMAPDHDTKHMDYRNQQNILWQRLRGLSQERHCLVVTATQAAASSYSRDVIVMGDFSEDKRKYGHVTAMYGLNQTMEEKKIGLMRVNELVVREGDFDRSHTIKILQRLQQGRPFLGSFM